MPGRLTVCAAVVAALLGLSACGAGASSDSEVDAAQLPAGADPGVAHVHGLGVDPADGLLYAATHYGLFRIPEQGKASRVANRMQDTMGFTVVGPKTFLGSGHPDGQKDPHLPPRLGLIRSTDAAQTWQSVSLSGEADFHVLHTAHGNIYGWDSGTGRLMVSGDDGGSWQSRSTLGLRDFVVSPDDPQVLLATTERGLLHSSDGGRSFQGVGGPALVVLAWGTDDNLVGLDSDGVLHASGDGGGSWASRGSLDGPPEALATDGDKVYAAVSSKGVFASADGGKTWKLRYSDSRKDGR